MRGTVLYGPRDIRFAERLEPVIVEPTDAIIRLSATCVCGPRPLALPRPERRQGTNGHGA
jgi:hypothetical protein